MLNIATRKIFDLLRKCDKLNVSNIYIKASNNSGLGNSMVNWLEYCKTCQAPCSILLVTV